VEIKGSERWSFGLLAAALGLIAMVLPRVPRIRPEDIAGGVISIDPFSAGLLDGNNTVMSALLVAFVAIMTWLRPTFVWQTAIILGLAPAAWLSIVMIVHGPGDIWPIALVVAVGYGALIAGVGMGLGKFVALLSKRVRRPTGSTP
jgi:hypothetical protein